MQVINHKKLGLLTALSILSLINLVSGYLTKFNELNSQVCSGIYSKHDWGGKYKPSIAMKLFSYDKDKYDSKAKNQKGKDDVDVSFVIFEYKDLRNIGYDLGDGKYKYICDDYAIKDLGICEEKQKGKFIIQSNSPNSTILTSTLSHLGLANIHYNISRSGYYCISTVSMSDKKYSGTINFQNAFGHLSASEIPKLPAYGILTIFYAIALALYGFQFYKKRNQNQILPLQRYLLAMLGFLTFDTIVVWSYYDLVNRSKNPLAGFVTFYMFFLSFLNAAKISFSFFLLLCISLGYGVVVLKLKKKVMLKCKILAGCHFAATVLYLVANYYNGSSYTTLSGSTSGMDDGAGSLLGLLPLIPVTITLTIYYLAVLISIKKTTANLHKQRQIIKLQLYQNLFRIIFFSVVLTFGGLILSSFIYLSMSTTEMIEEHWKGAFFIFDFWPSVVFYGVFMGIAWLWRPTETSYMLAISQQLSTEETADNEEGETDIGQGYHQGHEFELDDLSLISHSDNENAPADEHDSFELSRDENPPPQYSETEAHQDKSKKSEAPADTADAGNTLFELGEESEDEHKDDDRLKNK